MMVRMTTAEQKPDQPAPAKQDTWADYLTKEAYGAAESTLIGGIGGVGYAGYKAFSGKGFNAVNLKNCVVGGAALGAFASLGFGKEIHDENMQMLEWAGLKSKHVDRLKAERAKPANTQMTV